MMSVHYRQQINFTFEGLEAAQKALDRLRNFVHRLLETNGKPAGDKLKKLVDGVQRGLESAMDDDLNISVALAHLFDFVRDVNNLLDNGEVSKEEGHEVYGLMLKFDEALGVIGQVKKTDELPSEAMELIRKREEARKSKDWKTADELRGQLRIKGIIVEDTAQGVKWRIEKR
jgi:cysteinyl-tRNA synthetase